MWMPAGALGPDPHQARPPNGRDTGKQDLVYDHGFLHRVEGGIGGMEDGVAPGAATEES